MKIAKEEIKRISKIINSALYDNQRLEQITIIDKEIWDLLKKAHNEINELQKTVIDFNIKYKTDITIWHYGNTISDRIIRIHQDRLNYKYSKIRWNIDTYLLTLVESSDTYTDFINSIETHYNINLK